MVFSHANLTTVFLQKTPSRSKKERDWLIRSFLPNYTVVVLWSLCFQKENAVAKRGWKFGNASQVTRDPCFWLAFGHFFGSPFPPFIPIGILLAVKAASASLHYCHVSNLTRTMGGRIVRLPRSHIPTKIHANDQITVSLGVLKSQGENSTLLNVCTLYHHSSSPAKKWKQESLVSLYTVNLGLSLLHYSRGFSRSFFPSEYSINCIHGQAEIKSAESFTRRSMAFVIHQISSSQLPSKTEG